MSIERMIKTTELEMLFVELGKLVEELDNEDLKLMMHWRVGELIRQKLTNEQTEQKLLILIELVKDILCWRQKES